jgi:hypothetical protein
MKNLKLNQMENINAGSDRACMIMGGLTVIAFICGGAAGIAAAMYTAAECA